MLLHNDTYMLYHFSLYGMAIEFEIVATKIVSKESNFLHKKYNLQYMNVHGQEILHIHCIACSSEII